MSLSMMEETDSNRFISALEHINVRQLEDWVIEEDEDGIQFVIANSKAALEHFQADQSKPGDFALNTGFIPASFFERREFADLNIKMGVDPGAFLQSIMPMLRLTGDSVESAVVNENELVSLGDKYEAGLLKISNEKREGMFIVFEAAEGVMAFVSAVGYPGELHSFLEIAFTIAASIEYRGSVENLITAFYRS
jgi:hypothetical protein